jgi:hypothetical protein
LTVEALKNMSDLPQLSVTLRPWQVDGKVTQMDVGYTIWGLELDQGDRLALLHLVVASIPACEFSEAGLVAQDQLGTLPLTVSIGPGKYGQARIWTCDRKPQGPVTLNYRVYPREVGADYTSSPFFDLRSEPGGMNGAGVPFMVLLPERTFEISLHWNLSHMPAGSRGVWCKGEGDVTLTAPQELMAFSYYAVGALKTWRAPDSDKFELHWFSEPNFDLAAVAQRAHALFKCMSAFFDDKDTPYKVFVRKDPFEKSGGGTALEDSFMFGYSDTAHPTPDDIQDLLAHELVHNWPHMDEPEAYRTWYDEGTAEYYSLVLPYRAGLSTLEHVLDQIQQRANVYYGNPLRHISSEEAAELYWKDRRTQRIPYGRGFFYLIGVDHAIRAASGGKRSVDDVVLALVKSHRQSGKMPKCADWLEAVSGELGREARPEFDAMHRGQLLIPSDGWFGGVFKVRPSAIPQYVNKWEVSQETIEGYIWERNPDVPDAAALI